MRYKHTRLPNGNYIGSSTGFSTTCLNCNQVAHQVVLASFTTPEWVWRQRRRCTHCKRVYMWDKQLNEELYDLDRWVPELLPPENFVEEPRQRRQSAQVPEPAIDPEMDLDPLLQRPFI